MPVTKERHMTSARPIVIETADGTQLQGDLFTAQAPQFAVLMSSGTGFPKRIYRHFAQDFARRGATVLTYDYRGIAIPDPDSLAGSQIDYPDWGRLDMPAALEALHQEAPDLPITHVAHSVGGHFLGLMPNQHLIQKHAFVSVGAGYWRNHHRSYVPMEMYFWWLLGSYSLLRHGYLKPIGGWSGEAIPPQVFRTWRRWCHTNGFFKPDLTGYLAPQHYDQVTAPIRSWIFSDDPIATPVSGAELLSVYPNAPQDIRQAHPAEFGVRGIGHEGAFRPGCEALWQEIWDWLTA
jgi:predicted alpha/beta hydrolase